MMDRISICEALAKRNDPFLKRMEAEDEKWGAYDNIVRKQSLSKRGEAAQTVAKPGLTTRKVLLYLYCQQLDRLKLAIDQKRPELANRRGAVFYQDNARPHTSVVTRQKLWELGWEVLMRLPYSPDLAPNYYHLFLALQNFLSDKKLGSREDCENRLLESLVYADKPQTLDHLEDNIRRVIADIRPQMLEKVIENWTSRLDYIRASRGSHVPEIIFKM
ncbi:histone-lysine N-methyltransferase SETMAR [Trichonephila clavipes]|nr:histone-lysine N-methyltransferase SETMAR [Trichonephila clavipes]